MKRLFAGVFAFVSLFAVQHESYAQAFSGTYTFGANGVNNPFAYNGATNANLTVSALVRTNLPASSSAGNFRSTGFALDASVGTLTGTVDTNKYFEFSLAATPGYTFDMTGLNFGFGRSGTGPRTFQWRSSVDGFSSVLTNYTLGSSGLFTNNSGAVSFITDSTSTTGTNITLNISSSSFQSLTAVTFRCYMYNAEASGGSGGFQAPFNFSGTMIAPVGSPAIAITTPATNVPFETPSINIEGTANEVTVGDLSWTNSLTGAAGSIPAATSWTISGIALDVGANTIAVTGTNLAGDSAQSSVTITRNDFVPTNVQFSASSVSLTEADLVYTVTVRKTVSSGDLSGEISLTGTATADSDYTINTTNFTMNGAVTSATFEVTIINDFDEEGSETILLSLTNVVGGGIAAPSLFTITIQGNDGVQANLLISEVADPSDAANAKFVEIYNPGTSSVNLAAGNWNLSRQSNGGATISSLALTGVIAAESTYVIGNVSNDFVIAFAQQANQYSTVANGNGDDAYFLYFGGPHTSGTLVDVYGVLNQTGTLAWAYLDGRAVRNASVTNGNTTWTGSEWSLFVPSAAATMTPGSHPETFLIPTNVSFASSAASISETGLTYVVTINKSLAEGNVSGEIVIGGSAVIIDDYSIDTTNFTMNGATTSATFTVTIVDNLVDELNKTVVLTIANVSGADVIEPSVFTLTIFDDDLEPPPVDVIAYYTFTGETNTAETVAANAIATPLTLSEGVFVYTNSSASSWNGSGVPFVRGTGGWTNDAQNVAKEFQVTVSADSGYVLTVTNISIRCRATSAGPSALGLTLNGNSVYSDNAPTGTIPSVISQAVSGYDSVASVVVGIQGWTNGSRATTGNGDLQLDDILVQGFVTASGPGTPAIQFDSSSASASEAGVSIDVTITKSNGIGDVTGELSIGGTAPGADYSLSTTNISLLGAATFQDITITLVNNGAVDGDRTLILTITNLVGGDTGSPATYTLTITDDDTSSPPPVPSSTNAFTSVTVSGGTITAVLQSSDTNFQYNFQYYTALPGTPTVLTTSNGTGSSITFKDISPTNAVRIYGVEAFYPTP